MALDLSQYANVSDPRRRTAQTFNLGNLWIDQEGGYSRDADGQRYWDPEGTAIQNSYYMGGAPGAGEKLFRLDDLSPEVRDTYIKNIQAAGGQIYDMGGMRFTKESAAVPTWKGYGGGADGVNAAISQYAVPALMALAGAAAGGTFGNLSTYGNAGGTFGAVGNAISASDAALLDNAIQTQGLGGATGGSVAPEFSLTGQGSGLGLQTGGGVGLQAPAVAPGAEFSLSPTSPFSLGGGSTGYGLGGNAAIPAAGATTTAAGSGIWSQIINSPVGSGLKSVIDTFAPGGPQAGKVPGLENLVGGIWQYFTQKDNAQNLQDATNAGIARTDPFGPERSFFQGELRKLFTDPNYLQSTPGYQAGIQQVNRRNAKLGQMFSGQNAIDNINFGTDQQLKLSGPLLQAAGAGITPGYAGYLGQQGAQLANQANTGAQGALATAGKGLWDIFRSVV